MECFVPERGADTGTHMTGAWGGGREAERENCRLAENIINVS